MKNGPFLSIIMPVYNHEHMVERAIRSCLEQGYGDFEIVAVDDASTDRSAAVIDGIDDRRVHLFRHEKNRGVCPSRNSAMDHARGEWFVFFDSDDELLPGALDVIRRRAAAAPPDVGGLRFMCIDEEGLSPDPPHDDAIWDYEAYLRWFDVAVRRRQESLACMRASFYPEVRFADDRSSEYLYHLDLFSRTKVKACRDVVRRYHHHSGERITAPSLGRSMLVAPDIARANRSILQRHGEAIRRFAPYAYRTFIGGAASAAFLSGDRRGGVRYGVEAIRLRPWTFRTWLVVVCGLIGRYPLLLFQWLNRETRRRIHNARRRFSSAREVPESGRS